MMDFFSRKRLSISVIILLVVFNLISLGTFWYREVTHTGPHDRSSFRNQRPSASEREKRLQKELGLDAEQVKFFGERRIHFFSQIDPNRAKARQLNIEIIQEAFKPTPNQNLISEKWMEIGDIEVENVKALYHHVQELKSVTSPKQHERLEQFFVEIFRRSKSPKLSDSQLTGGPPPRPAQEP